MKKTALYLLNGTRHEIEEISYEEYPRAGFWFIATRSDGCRIDGPTSSILMVMKYEPPKEDQENE